MAKKWAKFPHPDKAYVYDAAGLKKNWARLHKGDGEPLPKDAGVLEAWLLRPCFFSRGEVMTVLCQRMVPLRRSSETTAGPS